MIAGWPWVGPGWLEEQHGPAHVPVGLLIVLALVVGLAFAVNALELRGRRAAERENARFEKAPPSSDRL